MKYIYIAAGGFLGALLRELVKTASLGGPFINTLIINASGSFLLALILTMASESFDASPDIVSGVSVGFLGAFTTFSAYCKEINDFLSAGAYPAAALYAISSVVLGLLAAYTGMKTARTISQMLSEEDSGGEEVE